MSRVVIVGGGLAGCLAALALSRRKSDLQLLLVEQGKAFGGNHTWSWFDTDVQADEQWVLEGIAAKHWPDHDIRFPRRRRTIPIGYNSVRSADLDRAVQSCLKVDDFRLGAAVEDLGARHVILETGERIEADAVIDARGPTQMPGQGLGWQKFVGRVYHFAGQHGIARPVVMDATVAQRDGYRFIYTLPLSSSELLLEDTYYSASPVLGRQLLREGLDEAASRIASTQPEAIQEESGVLPVLVDGDFDALWPRSDPVPKLGVRGGFFHPTTSYSLADAVANAALLAKQQDFSAAALASLLRCRASGHWRERRFFQLLNRMLFRAASPDQRYRVLEHFYRLSPDVIARFYAARLTSLDKMRILSGRPPVPVLRAMTAIFKRAA